MPLLLVASATAGGAQDSAAAAPLIRVFVECGACEGDYLRTELTFVNLVRDRKLADVHVLVTSLSAGGGGRQYSIELNGEIANVERGDTVLVDLRVDATNIERREALVGAIKIALLPFMRGNAAMSGMTVTYRAPAGGNAGTARGERDRWNGWVYRLNAGGGVEADDNYGSQRVNSGLSARRTTAAIKIELQANGNYRKNRFTLEDERVIYSHQRSWSVEGVGVKSLGSHLSAGMAGSTGSSIFGNTSLTTKVAAAVEYNLFPYREATQRQAIVQYTIGARATRYVDTTIFGRIRETRPVHDLTLATEIRQRWGSVNADAYFSQYLHDTSKRRFNVDGGVEWRIAAGLNVNLSASYSFIRDQLNIPGTELTDEDRLLRLRELQSGYSFEMGFGISYTFGSLFNNIVNPRMRRLD
ncbi:MAG: hypothetical protein ABIW79_01620 [Gemmatimonas sp.]